MGGKSKAPPPPDYTPIAAASKEAAEVSAAVAREQLAWAREQYAADREITDDVVADAMRRADEQDALARKDRERYETVFQPLEDELVADAKSYSSEARQEQEAGKAAADVSQQFDAARNNAMQQLESYGVDPTQTRAGALDISVRAQEAAARAGAANNARERTEATGRALRGEAINIGRGLPGQAAGSLNAAIQSGNQAVNAGNSTTATGAQSMGTGVQWQGQSTNALNTWGNTLNMGYQNALDRTKANNSSSSGWGSALGLVGGALMSPAKPWIFSDERAKEDITPVGKTDDGQTVYKFRYKDDESGTFHMGLLAQEVEQVHPEAVTEGPEGIKMVDYDRALPVGDSGEDKPRYAEGGAVPANQSPSRGAAVDDVDARLSVGEFVVPKEVVRWKGEEFFQKVIDGARKAKESVTAKPRYALEV